MPRARSHPSLPNKHARKQHTNVDRAQLPTQNKAQRALPCTQQKALLKRLGGKTFSVSEAKTGDEKINKQYKKYFILLLSRHNFI